MDLPAVPFPLSWSGSPAAFAGEGAGLTITAPRRTDLFADPAGGDPILNAPRLLGSPPDDDFQLAARVTVHFEQTYDAGVLLAWVNDRHWAKLCFERSPQATPMAVSVVTRDTSDDANAFTAPGNTLWLRLSRLGPAFAFHASTDGTFWQLIRYFALDVSVPPQVGFLAQSPTGDGCTVRFDEVQYASTRLANLRDGT